MEEGESARRGFSLRWWIPFGLLFAVFLAGGIYFGLIFLRNLEAFIQRPNIGLVPFPSLVGKPSEDAPDWKAKERTNILLLGIDKRPDEENIPTRTDTMMVVSIDPYSKSAAMLSIPRDLWVPIPVSDKYIVNDRINNANVYGELNRYPGGGPALAKKTVQYNLGVKIHYYVVIDFEGFVKIIDAMGGLTLDVKKPLVDDAYPTPDYGTMRVYIPAGLQHMDGETALQYARSRHQDSDIGRIRRQQEVLMAMRERALQLNLLPRLPQLLRDFADIVKTDMSISEALNLALLTREIPSDRIQGYAIDERHFTFTTTPAGADVLLPNRTEIAKLVREVFFDARQQEEAARIEVLNGTRRQGLATNVASILESRGWSGVSFGNAPSGESYKETRIFDYTGKRYSAGLIADLLQIPRARIQSLPEDGSPVDIRIILGEDAQVPQQ